MNDLDHHTPFRRSFPCGLLLWLIFPLLAIAVRGIHWDEHSEFAPILLKNMAYPEFHPLVMWITYVKNLQILLSAAVLQVTQSPDILNVFRNVLFLWATCIPAYVTGYAVTKHQFAGHAAVILLLFDLHAPFSSNYPWYTWPHFFSTGHVGRGFTMLGLSLLLLNKPRTALLCIGFAPVVHLGQTPVLVLATIIYMFKHVKSCSKTDALKTAAWLLPGLLLFAGLWLSQPEPPQIPESNIYHSSADPDPIIRGYLEMDPHRAKPGTWIPYTNGNILLLFATLISIGLALRTRNDQELGPPVFLLASYVSLCAGVVWSCMGLHLVLGDRIPLLIIGAMPYRFANHVAYLLPVLFLAALNHRGLLNDALAPFLACLMLYPVLQFMVPHSIYGTYVTSNGLSVFVMLGVMAGCVTLPRFGDKFSFVPFVPLLLALAITAVFHQLGALVIVVGFGLIFAADYCLNRRQIDLNQSWTMPLLIVSLGTLLIQQHRIPSYYDTSTFHKEVTRILADASDPGRAVLAPHDQVGLQSRINFPVLVDYPLKTNIPYHHYLAPTIEKMYSELYGLSFLDAPASYERDWRSVWRERSAEEWQTLGNQWEFRYVLNPEDTDLPLEEVLRGDHVILYRIPK